MSRYTVTAERSGEWWVLQATEAPGAISQIAQLRDAGEIKEAIAFVTGEAEDEIEIVLDHEYEVSVTRDGGWWMVHIPELGGLTQARSVDEVPLMAAEYVAVTTGALQSGVKIRLANP
ncbi:hypothetical protein [Leifsonia shinshuensis]|uniref:hypothetical protein n=1 Tax=Leifsonia shinshuensis TaxID=150026 RepID=UPI002857D15B|nr:hypothetical protein [Leifsonia shinshuensis]MDR6972671.1 putative RNase H-like HicB family nuclease [Leifsonia shinshuensis]